MAVAGTGSTANFGAISGSGLDITGNANIAGNLTLGGNITIGDQTTDTVTVTANLSSSLIPSVDNAFDVGSTSKRYRNIYAQTISASVLTNLTGSVNKIAYFTQDNKVQDSGIFRVLNNGSTISIGTTAFDATNPERFIVEAPNTSFNIATFQTINQTAYAQVNIKNLGSGSASSTDLVLWNDQTSETSSFVDLGINSSNYSAGAVGYGGDGYLINAANDMYIGSANSGSHGHVHLYGGNLWNSSSISIYNDGTIGINTDKFDNNASTIPTAGFAVEISGSVKFANGLTVTGSIKAPQLDALATITGSLISSASNLTQRVAANEAVSSSYARTNSSNIFNGSQTITGSLYISQDLVVAGSSSIQNVSSSNVVIGSAYVTLNSFSPASRFAGLKVYDSGSNAGTASIVWDSLNNKVLYQHPSGADTYNSAWLISGPANAGALGSETGLTINKLQKATDDDHIGDSQIIDDGTTVSIAGNLDLTGSLKAPQLTAIATITGSLITSQSAATTSVANLNAASSSYETKGRGIVSGSSQIPSILPAGVVSGSSQIDATATTNFATGIKTQLNSNTVVSGSSQVALASTTGFGTYINQAVLTSSAVTFASVAATGDIVAYSTSDKRHKNTIQTISNAVLKVKQLNGVTWEWNDDVNEVTKQTPKTGLIAQEVQSVLPQVVKEREDGFLSLDYSKMVGLLVEAIKEQQIQIDNLTAKVEELKIQRGL